jgi:hypothetical protein
MLQNYIAFHAKKNVLREDAFNFFACGFSGIKFQKGCIPFQAMFSWVAVGFGFGFGYWMVLVFRPLGF